MRFSEFSLYLEKLEKTSSRIEITKILADLIKKAESSEIDKICYLVLGSLRPKYEGLVFNLAEKMVIEAIAIAYDTQKEDVVSLFKEKGDLGDVALFLSGKKGIKGDLSVEKAYNLLVEIARDEGEGSQERKINKLSEILLSLGAILLSLLSE